jgi:hypothetical protein
MTLSLIYVTPQMFPTIAGIAVIAAVCYMIGIYTGAYAFPVESHGLSPEDRKMLSELYRVALGEHAAREFDQQYNNHPDDEDCLDELKSHEEQWYEYTRKESNA